jgi:DNA polymerase-3 subunit alpha
MKNFLFLDSETTGLNADKQDIIQLACIPIVNGVEQNYFNEYCQPLDWSTIQNEALAIHGLNRQKLTTFQKPSLMIESFIKYLKQFNCKFVISGHSVPFDKGFLSAFFRKNNKILEYSEFFEHEIHDTLNRSRALNKSILPVSNYKLGTLCSHFNIKLEAHNAISDIRATVELDKHLSRLLEESDEYCSTSASISINKELRTPALLHTHSQFSIFDGILAPDEWLSFAINKSLSGISFTDHGSGASVYQAVRVKEFVAKYNKENKTNVDLTGVPGLGIYLSMDGDINEYSHLNAWATSNAGYYNLMKISSLAYDKTAGKDKIIPINFIEHLQQYSDGIVFGLSDVDSYVGKAILAGDAKLAEDRLLELLTKLNNNLILEMCPVDITNLYDKKAITRRVPKNSVITDGNLQKSYNIFLSQMADKHALKIIPSINACFIEPSDKKIQDCMCQNGYSDGFRYHSSYHYLDTNQIFKGLKSHLGDWLDEDKYNQMVDVSLDIVSKAKSIDIKFGYQLPSIAIPQYIKDRTADYNEQLKLYTLDRINHHGRMIKSPVYMDRLKTELNVITNNSAMNFLPYFLMYEDLGRFARDAGFLQNIARGSAGGSLLSYYLKIIHVDPVKANLPFERFLSFARINAGSWPDIDMDISKSARPHLMKYLKEIYGLGFAQVATFSTMKVKNAIKDAMAFLYERRRGDFEVEDVCKTIPDSQQGVDEYDFLYGYTDKEGEYHMGEVDRNDKLRAFFARYHNLESMVKRLIGIVRGFSRHPSAFAISTSDIAMTVPTMKMWDKHMNDYINVTQYDGPMIEKSGIVKADILGLKTLSSVTEAAELIKKNHGVDLLEEDENGVALIYRLPEDKGVYSDFCRKDTDSSFQFNSNVIKSCIADFRPAMREHLSALTALKRPGAMDAFMDESETITADRYYTEAKNNLRKVEYIHPDLEPIVGETYGVIVYQEQVMRCLVEICGYTLEETDIIRSAIAKKKHDVMMAAFDRIRISTAKRGWTPEQSDRLCKTIMAFSRYSFNRSHSYAYAELGYITMYLKHHYANEWWSSVLNHEDDDDKVRHFISYLGDKIQPPSMKVPSDKYMILNDKIYAPVNSVKSVGEKAAAELCQKGPFTSLDDYIKRIDHSKVNIGVVRQLIKARAADPLMDSSLDYFSARRKFMEEYLKSRKSKTNFGPELEDDSYLSAYFLEKEVSACFNKTLVSIPEIQDWILNNSALKNIEKTNNKHLPFKLGSTMIVKDLATITKLMENPDAESYFSKNEVGVFLMLNKVWEHSGTSKKSGKDYTCVKAVMSDGFNEVETIDFLNDMYNIETGSLVFISGIITKGWKTPLNIKISNIELLIKAGGMHGSV